MSTIDTKALEELHGILARRLTDAVTNTQRDEKGFASILNVARQFLKDNAISSAFNDPDMQELATALESIEELPFEGYH